MQSLPFSIARHFRELTWRQLDPVIFLLDDEFHVLGFWGDTTRLCPRHPQENQDLRDLFPVLYSFDLQTPMEMPFVSTTEDRSVHMHWFPKPNENTLICLDATEEHNRHQELQQIGNEAQIRNYREKQLRKALQEARDAAERANKLKSQFIAGMSHEFRTPLTAITGYAKRLAGQHSDDATRHALSAIQRGARHLLLLIDNLLSQGRVDAGERLVNPKPNRLLDLVEDLRAIFGSLAEEKGLHFAVIGAENLPDTVEIDALRLRQVLVNLIGNAMKFTRQGSIEVTFAWQQDRLSFTVADTGAGIAKHDQGKIFTAFGRSGQQDQAGAGLGLSISLEIVNQMEGELGLESELGQGSRFFAEVKAPRVHQSPQSAQVIPEPKTQLAPGKRKKVLLAEDDADIADLIKLSFADAGIQVSLVEDGDKVLVTQTQVQADLIITDMNLPGLSGTEIALALRQSGFKGPIIGHSADPSERATRAALKAGCDRYLVKPISMDKMVAIVLEALNKQSTMDSQTTATPSANKPNDPLIALRASYIKTLPTKRQDLLEAWERGENMGWGEKSTERLRFLTHKLAGSASTYGFKAIGEPAKQIDQALSSGELGKDQKTPFQQLMQAIDQELA